MNTAQATFSLENCDILKDIHNFSVYNLRIRDKSFKFTKRSTKSTQCLLHAKCIFLFAA